MKQRNQLPEVQAKLCEYASKYNSQPHVKKRNAERAREKYWSDSEFREKKKETMRNQYHINEQYKDKALKNSKERYIKNKVSPLTHKKCKENV